VARASNNQQRPAVYNQFAGLAYFGTHPVANAPAVQAAPTTTVAPTPAPAHVTPAAPPATAAVPKPTPVNQDFEMEGTKLVKYRGNAANVTIPVGVTEIGWDVFNKRSLTGISIPASVTSINSHAFVECTGLTSITVAANNQHYASEDGILYNKARTALIAYPSARGVVTIPEGVTSIGASAFYRCAGLTEITIPEGVTSIGTSAFYCCTSLAEITIPEGVTSIGDEAFCDCLSLTAVTIPASVRSIGNSAFSGVTYHLMLTTVTFSADSQLTSIGKYAFYKCPRLTNITIPSSVTTIGERAFAGWTASQTINVQGKANQAAADKAWGKNWRKFCKAKINYSK